MFHKRKIVHKNQKFFEKEHFCRSHRDLNVVPNGKFKKEHFCTKIKIFSKKNICVGESQMCQSTFVSEKSQE